VSAKLEILEFLNNSLQSPPLDILSSYGEEVFDRATTSQDLIKRDIEGQVRLWCRRGSFFKNLAQSDLENLRDQKAGAARSILYSRLCVTLLGHRPNSIEMANLFAGDKPIAKRILASTNPEAIKIREHLAPAMITMELFGLAEVLALRNINYENEVEVAQATERFMHRADRLTELLVFRRSVL
jgi:hypothetical protein